MIAGANSAQQPSLEVASRQRLPGDFAESACHAMTGTGPPCLPP